MLQRAIRSLGVLLISVFLLQTTMCVAFLEYLMLSTRAAFGMFLTLSLNWAALIPVHRILIVGVGERARSFFAGGSGEVVALRFVLVDVDLATDAFVDVVLAAVDFVDVDFAVVDFTEDEVLVAVEVLADVLVEEDLEVAFVVEAFVVEAFVEAFVVAFFVTLAVDCFFLAGVLADDLVEEALVEEAFADDFVEEGVFFSVFFFFVLSSRNLRASSASAFSAVRSTSFSLEDERREARVAEVVEPTGVVTGFSPMLSITSTLRAFCSLLIKACFLFRLSLGRLFGGDPSLFLDP